MMSLVIVAQTCDPRYSGGRYWEITVQSQPWQIFCHTQSQKQPSQKRANGVAHVVGPEFKLQYLKRRIQ
jgi:hypothetical protein